MQQKQRRRALAPNQAPQAHDQGQNMWSFLIVATVVVALLALVMVLVAVYTNTPGTIATIMGIVVPVFAAVFGYAGGTATGMITGKQQGRQEVKNQVLPQLTALRQHATGIFGTIRTHAVSPPGSGRWMLQTDFTQNHVDL
jgi:hypothetical protein